MWLTVLYVSVSSDLAHPGGGNWAPPEDAESPTSTVWHVAVPPVDIDGGVGAADGKAGAEWTKCEGLPEVATAPGLDSGNVAASGAAPGKGVAPSGTVPKECLKDIICVSQAMLEGGEGF